MSDYHKARYAADPEKYRALSRAYYHNRKAAGHVPTEEQMVLRRERARLSALRHPETARRRRLKKLYGITPEDYDALLAAQGGGCAICTEVISRNGRALHVDHCHETAMVRGILCDRCNTSIGKFDESPALLRAAAAYLEGNS